MTSIARTEPRWHSKVEVRENEALHLDMIRRAKRLIYLENQYFTSPIIAAALRPHDEVNQRRRLASTPEFFNAIRQQRSLPTWLKGDIPLFTQTPAFSRTP